MGTHRLTKPRDVGTANNPHRGVLDEEWLSTQGGSDYLRERWGIDISVIALNARRSFGKAPKFVKVGQAGSILYRKADLDEFARTKGLSGLPEREPERRAKN